jgi:hypothetical protein
MGLDGRPAENFKFTEWTPKSTSGDKVGQGKQEKRAVGGITSACNGWAGYLPSAASCEGGSPRMGIGSRSVPMSSTQFYNSNVSDGTTIAVIVFDLVFVVFLCMVKDSFHSSLVCGSLGRIEKLRSWRSHRRERFSSPILAELPWPLADFTQVVLVIRAFRRRLQKRRLVVAARNDGPERLRVETSDRYK